MRETVLTEMAFDCRSFVLDALRIRLRNAGDLVLLYQWFLIGRYVDACQAGVQKAAEPDFLVDGNRQSIFKNANALLTL